MTLINSVLFYNQKLSNSFVISLKYIYSACESFMASHHTIYNVVGNSESDNKRKYFITVLRVHGHVVKHVLHSVDINIYVCIYIWLKKEPEKINLNTLFDRSKEKGTWD